MVGLVEHGDLHRVEPGMAALDEIFQAARAGDDDVDAAAQRVDLRAGADAAEHRRGAQPSASAQRPHRGVHLVGQLTGRHEDQAAGLLRLAASPAGGQAHHHRQDEGDRLAGTGAAATEQVATGEGVDERRLLDRERVVRAVVGEHAQEGCGDAELGEARPVRGQPVAAGSTRGRAERRDGRVAVGDGAIGGRRATPTPAGRRSQTATAGTW